jgi:outer membrane protein
MIYIKTKRFYSLLICLTFFGIANAQQKLTLSDAVQLSIKNSKQLQVSKAKIEAANASLIEAKNNLYPNADVSGSYLRLLQPTVKLNNSSGSSANSPSINQALYGSANVSYPIYTGGKIKYGIESARYLLQATSLDAENDKQAVALTTINAYMTLYKAQIAVAILTHQLEASRQRDTTFAHLEANGLLPRNDLLKTELQTSNLELQLLERENDVRLTAFNIGLMLGVPAESISIDTNLITVPSFKTLSEYQTLALQNRKDLLAIAPRKKAAEANIKLANASAYPAIAATAGYIAADIPGFLTVTNAVNYGIGVKYNIASLWKKNSSVMKARVAESELSATQAQLTDVISLQVNTAYQNYLLSTKKIEVYKKATMQAAENYRITKNKYDNSLATITDLLEADAANREAQLNERLAEADERTAYYSLLYTAGILNL